MDYHEFITKKRKRANKMGIVVDAPLNSRLFDWQSTITDWALRRGRAAIFAECGLGKTAMQLTWAMHVHQHTQAPIVIHCPIGVREQTIREAKKFRIKCRVQATDDQAGLIDGINLINYEKLHKFDFSECAGVVLDESSILKSVDGKTYRALVDQWGHARFRLACTATPAPNDHIELGNHAEFLGVCQSIDMLNRFFVHDSGETQTWRLRKHAVDEFWRWVASWAVCISKPSDINGDDTGFDLPGLEIHRHYADTSDRPAPKGMFFATSISSATSIHSDRRETNQARCEKVAEIVKRVKDFVIVWCDTNYEADLLAKLIPDAVEVRGSDSAADKERKLLDFSEGRVRVLISKPSIAGFGMNWQHCNQMVFAGVSYSFEKFYQAVRRCFRFGQERTVHVHLILTDTDSGVQTAVQRKSMLYDTMRSQMAEAMRAGTLEEFGLDQHKTTWTKSEPITLPGWLL